MRGLLTNRLVVAALVLVVAAALYAAAGSSRPVAAAAGRQAGTERLVPVSAAVRACPDPGSGGTTAGKLAIASAPAGTSQAGARAVVSRLAPGGATLTTLTAAGRLAAPAVPKTPATSPASHPGGTAVPTVPSTAGVEVQASGPLAEGLEVEQADPAGRPAVRCPQPGTDFWFAGPGVESAANIELYLMNTDSLAADAQVTAETDNGPVLGSADSGIPVPAHGAVVQSLSGLLRGSRAIALHVSSSTGRIEAAVRVSRTATAPGTWLPPLQAPAKTLVLPGLPASAGARQLYVAAPGTANAQVKVTAVTAKGSYQPTGGSGLDLPGGTATQIPLPSLSSIAAALVVRSNVPVVASVMVPGGSAGAPGALTGSAGPVSAQNVFAASPGGPGQAAGIVLSAPRTAAAVRVITATTTAGFGSQQGQQVHISAAHTIVDRIRAPAGSAHGGFAILIIPQPGSGPVYAGDVASAGSAVRAMLPALSSPTRVPLPPVRESLTAVLP